MVKVRSHSHLRVRPPMKRPSYHHGDLANALTAAATQLAREGGPDAVVLREAARQVGVSATAAYRHFTGHGDLMHAVKNHAAEQLAASMRIELDNGTAESDPRGEALRRAHALGRGYLRFALTEPGLFRTAFCRPSEATGSDDQTFDLGLAPPYQMLVDSIDALVAVGLLAPDRRPWAETFAWSSVHGLAMLLLDGPLRLCSPPEQEQIIQRVLEGVAAGLTSP
jgi:AcrR family transcriptional regulator